MNSSDEPVASPRSPHAALDEYVTGGLSAEQRREVQKHLDESAEWRAELAKLQQLRADLKHAYDTEPGPGPHVRDAVFARIEADTKANPQSVDAAVPIARKRRAPSLPRWAQLAAVVLILVQAGLLLRSVTAPVVPSDVVTPRGLDMQPTRLRVVFAPTATAAQIHEVLETLGARIVDGPTDSGEYRIELSGADPGATASKLAAARARRDVVQSLDSAP